MANQLCPIIEIFWNLMKQTSNMEKKIIIRLDSYDLKEAKTAIVKKIIKDKPDISIEGAAKELGISLRTLFRFIHGTDIKFAKKSTQLTEEKAISFLKDKGYKIKK